MSYHYIATLFTINKLIIIASSFLFTWIISTFEIIKNVLKVSDYTFDVLAHRWIEVVIAIMMIACCSYIVKYAKNSYVTYKKNKSQKKKIQSIGHLDVRTDLIDLSVDNSVYLTKFKIDSKIIYAIHTMYGFYSYYKDPINLFFL